MGAVFSHIARKMNSVCISHTIKSHMIYNCHRLQFNYSAIWADTDIRIIVKITAQSVRRIFIVLSLKYSLFY